MEEIQELFCGSRDIYPNNSDFKPRSQPWDSDSLVGQLTRNDVTLPESDIMNFKPNLWNDLCSEYDAENFCNYLKDKKYKLSNDFKAFEFVWRRDEFNHYLGFRHIYSIFYEKPEQEILSELNSRLIDFEPISNMLEDEFQICLLIAYDEIATTKSYSQDYDFYNLFEHKNFLKWIKKVARDEAYHFNNCMELIGKNHYHRVSEIPNLVDKFIEWDLNGGEYNGTFVLDHEGHYFTEDFLSGCGKIMKNYFR